MIKLYFKNIKENALKISKCQIPLKTIYKKNTLTENGKNLLLKYKCALKIPKYQISLPNPLKYYEIDLKRFWKVTKLKKFNFG